jgi:hypothetical protein
MVEDRAHGPLKTAPMDSLRLFRRDSFFAPRVLDEIEESSALLLEKPERFLEDLCKKHH